MSSEYEKRLEDANARLVESLDKAQTETDEYKEYVDLLIHGTIDRFVPFDTEGGSDGWMPHITGQKIKQTLHITLKTEDFDNYPILHEKIDQYIEQRRKYAALREEKEILWEARKRIIIIAAICLAVAGSLWGIGWLVWCTYFIPL